MIGNRLLKVIVFLLLVLFLDQAAGRISRKLYFTQKTGQGYSLNHVFSDCNTPVLIFGNSRAQHHYDTRILSDSLKLSCYNAGLDGGHSILLPYAQIEVLTKRYHPRVIILEFDPASVEYRKEDYEKLSVLLPYYSAFPEVRPLIFMKSTFEKIKLLSLSYPFNSNIVNIIRYNTQSHAARKKDVDGYLPMNNRELTAGMLKGTQLLEHENPCDTNKLAALQNIIRLCKKQNIFLVIVNSPEFFFKGEQSLPLSPDAKQAMEVIHQENGLFLDFSHDAAFAGRMDLFADKLHLNLRGATIYSGMIGGWLAKNVNPVEYQSKPN